jgi:hypothetical protein
LTLASDRILDLRDEINSLEFCLSNVELSSYVHIEKEEILKCLDVISDKLVNNTYEFKNMSDVSKISNRMSLALKIEYIKEDVCKLEKIKVSQHVYDFIKNV